MDLILLSSPSENHQAHYQDLDKTKGTATLQSGIVLAILLPEVELALSGTFTSSDRRSSSKRTGTEDGRTILVPRTVQSKWIAVS